MKRPPAEEITRMKEELYRDLARGTTDIRQATRRMRKILGMSQKEYARKVVGISPRILSELESGSGNPTLGHPGKNRHALRAEGNLPAS